MLRYLLISIAIIGCICISAQAQTADEVIASIQQSHIDANVPDKENFEAFLKRDLATYVEKEIGKPVKVEYELLRDGPTQYGIAFPKYFVWVVAKENTDTVFEGAARLAAMEKKQFAVTDFLKRSDIIASPEKLNKIFPKQVADLIRSRLKIPGAEAAIP